LRVVFFGTPDFAVPHLQALVDAGHDVALVVSRPDKPSGRGKKMQSPAVVVRARELGLDVVQPRAIKRGPFPERFAAVNADVAVVVAYGRILTSHYLDGPTHGCVNVHGSLLPRWRGAAPIQAAILAGDTASGVCAQRMTLGLDEGDVYLSASTPIAKDETAGSLYERLMNMGPQVLVDTLAGLPDLVPTPQDESAATFCGLIEKSHGSLDMTEDAEALDRRIRAMSPWPGGFITGETGALKIKSAQLTEGTGTPGTLLSTDPLVVACGTGALQLDIVQAPGRKAVSGRDFANGARLSVGDCLWA
jgi:methionyl-tRNA formyltransferase